MVVGNGLIARQFKEYDSEEQIIIFASGVSNSQENTATEFDREKVLLLEYLNNYSDVLFIYFSTTDILNKDKRSPYILHKKKMEEIIIKKSKKYLIFRLSQVVGFGGNSNNIVNFFYNRIKLGKKIEVYRKATRNIIDVSCIANIVNYFIKDNKLYNQIINIAAPKNTSVENIIKILEEILNKNSNKYYLDIGDDYIIDISCIRDIGCKCIYGEQAILKYF